MKRMVALLPAKKETSEVHCTEEGCWVDDSPADRFQVDFNTGWAKSGAFITFDSENK